MPTTIPPMSSRSNLPDALPGPVSQAWNRVRENAARVADDPLKPGYHFCPPSGWMNDPNGTIFHEGWFHLFYQHNPYRDEWGTLHWGHARSRDLVTWEHLPPALYPRVELGENHCWSGAAAINDAGDPMIFYTSIGDAASDPLDNAKQCIARGTSDMLVWDQDVEQPFITEVMHDGVKIYDWRDPYLFDDQGQTWMLLGGNLGKRQGGTGVVVMYRAERPDLTQWSYRGIIYRCPEWEVGQVDCPNLFRVGDKWVMLYSPWHGSIRYLVGSMDVTAGRFVAETFGLFDAGPDLFATNTAIDSQGRLVIWSWVRGSRDRRGWAGCLALPREVELGPAGELMQSPAREIATLREEEMTTSPRTLEGLVELEGVRGEQLELKCTLQLDSTLEFGLRVLASEDGEQGFDIRHDADGLYVGDTPLLSMRRGGGEAIDLHIFVDRCVVEVYIDGGRQTVTRMYRHAKPGNRVYCFTCGGSVELVECTAWKLRTPPSLGLS